MVILSIADMHMDLTAENKLSGTFRRNLDNFIKTLRGFCESKDGWMWKPDFICICGDIINRGKTDIFSQEEARSVIEEIARAVELENRHVMMVPGNHDLIRGKEEDKAEYVEQLELWLESKRSMPQEAVDAFTPYANFRKSFLEGGPSGLKDLAKGILPDGLADAVGCRIFEKEKIVFVELNSSWRDVGKVKMKEKDSEGNVIIRPREILFHRKYMSNVSDSVQDLRDRGFYVVTLFHHSLRFISPDQYVYDGRFNVYDSIINMSDICLSGHEHGSSSKEPDKLGNKCQYIQNGGFFSMSMHNQIIDSSATLIRIDRHKELLCTCRLVRPTGNNTWALEEKCNIYSTADKHINPFEKLRKSAELPHALNVRGLKSEDRQLGTIIRKLFGAGRLTFSEIKPSPKGVRRFEVQRGVEAGADAKAHVVILSAGEFDLREFQAAAEPGCVSVVVYKYRKGAPEYPQEYSRLKSELAVGILSGKIILTPASC